MIAYDSIDYEDGAGAVVRAMPPIAAKVIAELAGAIDFGVGEGFIAAVAPAEAAEDTEVRGEVLFEI